MGLCYICCTNPILYCYLHHRVSNTCNSFLRSLAESLPHPAISFRVRLQLLQRCFFFVILQFPLHGDFTFFNLPTNTKIDRKAAAKFRRDLLVDGFTIMQYSVYIRHCASKENFVMQYPCIPV